MTNQTCDARVRPFPNDTEVACEVEGEHDKHVGVLRDYGFKGSETKFTWFENDRRTFHGEWPGPCIAGCSLPLGHQGRCA